MIIWISNQILYLCCVLQSTCCWQGRSLRCWRLEQTSLPPAGLTTPRGWRWTTCTGSTLALSSQRNTIRRSTGPPSASPSQSLPLGKSPTCCCAAARKSPILFNTRTADVSTGSSWPKAVSTFEVLSVHTPLYTVYWFYGFPVFNLQLSVLFFIDATTLVNKWPQFIVLHAGASVWLWMTSRWRPPPTHLLLWVFVSF